MEADVEPDVETEVEADMQVDADIAWQAVSERNRRYDGKFVTGVLSTGIYCRPSCPARHPQRCNVRFFADPQAAREAGLRACKRCRPDDQGRDERAVQRALQALGQARGPVTLAELAKLTEYSATHLQRIFKREVGVSPAVYGRSLRRQSVESALRSTATVTEAIYESGYDAASRFYADTQKSLGMSASAWKNGGAGVTLCYAIVATDLGNMLVAASEKGVCRLSFNETEADLRAHFPNAKLENGGEAFAALLSAVVAQVQQPQSAHAIPLDVQGTAFQESVWRELQNIPAGETRSYSELAAAIGHPKAVRAVGSANGANTVAVLIPCHRVVRSDGSLGGYAYGVEIKRKLLEAEREASKD